MSIISNKIRPYSVMVSWNNKVVGSGVLVKSKDNKCYLFTAKHLFKKGNDKNHKGVKRFRVEQNLGEIFINRESFENKIFVDKILYFEEDLDLIVFSLKEDVSIQDLAQIKVLKNDHQVQDYHFYGYPEGAKNLNNKLTGHHESAIYIQSNEEERHVFRLRAKNNIDGGAVSGYSGSGIFIESKEKIEVESEEIETSIIYLVGILIRAKDGLSYYEGVDLSNIIEDINKKANLNIPIIEDVIDIEFTKNIRTRILNRNKDDIFIKQIKELTEDKEKLNFFLDSSENELLEMTKKLADFYLLGGMIYRDNGQEESAKKYFRLATKFNAKYKRYEKIYKDIDMDESKELINDTNYYHLGIIAFQHKEYLEAKDKFLKYLERDNIDKFEKIEIYQYLSKIYLNEKNYIEAEIYATQALDDCDENNIQLKAELCYKLFEICEERGENCSSKKWIEDGWKYVKENNDENILHIKNKLERERIKFEKDEYIDNMSPTLLELVQLYPERYIDEFIEAYRNSQNIKNKNYKIIHNKVIDLKKYLEDINNKEIEDINISKKN